MQGSRADLADKEKVELEILDKYLPAQMSEEEISKVVAEVVKEMKSKGEENFGKIMGEVMKHLKGKADASLVSAVLKRLI